MRTLFITFSIALASLVGLTGCANSVPSAPTSSKPLQGEMKQLGKMAPHITGITLTLSSNNLNINFPKLQNSTGENFASTPCQSTFTYLGSSENSFLGTTTHVYEGTFKANNNCALFTEQPSTTFNVPGQTQYGILESSQNGWLFSLAKDRAGQAVIAKGEVR
ncbi:MAG: hypothetical protein GX780_04995 [Campylobacteraceae bacterium]|nr:hypothetical protein [Campylobacteraceae bacterium]